MTMAGIKKKDELFKSLYLGEFVQIVVDSDKDGSLVVEGYVLDITDTEIYMGSSPDFITSTIQRFGYKVMTISEPHGTMFSEMPKPKAEDIN